MSKTTASARRAREDEAGDSFEVPAAILCAFCGRGDCAGCSAGDEQGSGVVAIVPWERPGLSSWTRLWATARATTQNADVFFVSLPDGALPPALRFAILAELLAVASMFALLLPFAVLAMPTLAAEIIATEETREIAFKWVALGVPALASWMVIAHMTHGAALDRGARRCGARPQPRRALRFGLYACGWDLMTAPLGALVTLFSQGARAMLELLALVMTVPPRAASAYLTGAHGLDAQAASRAGRGGTLGVVVLSILTGLGLLALFVWS